MIHFNDAIPSPEKSKLLHRTVSSVMCASVGMDRLLVDKKEKRQMNAKMNAQMNAHIYSRPARLAQFARHCARINPVALPHASRGRAAAAATAAAELLQQQCRLEQQEAQQIAQDCPGLEPERVQASVQELLQLYRLEDVQQLVKGSPGVLALPVSAWRDFFQGYGLSKEALWKCLRYSTEQLARSDVYTAGAAIRWLKEFGPWSDGDICNRLIPCYPEVLSTSTDTLQRIVDELSGLGMDGEQVTQLLWEFPGMLEAFRDENLPLIERMIQSRKAKYTAGGNYVD